MLIYVSASRIRRAVESLATIAPLAVVAALLLCNPASAQTADELAIPPRKDSTEKTGSVASASSPAKPSTTKSSAPESSFYTLQKTDQPLGLLKKRTGSSSEGSPSAESSAPVAPPPAPAPAQSRKPAPAQTGSRTTAEASSKSKPAPKTASKSDSDGSASTRSQKSSGNKSKSTSPDNLQADMAAVAILRTDKSSDKSSASDEQPRVSSSSSDSSDESNLAANSSDSAASSASGSAEAITLSGDVPPVSPAEATAPASAATELANAPMPLVAPAAQPAAPAPNLYLPQSTPRSGGFLSRLFHRDRSRQTGTAATAMQVPINFNSDYATRGNDDVCPVVLPGMGINGADIPIGSEDAYRLTSSLPTNFRPTDLVLLPNQYCHYGNPLYLRREAAASLCQMIAAAGQQGYKIRVVSAFRDYSHQMRLYTRAVARGGEDQKSVARPGRSEHFLGTTVDLTNDEAHALKRSFGDTPEGKWLAANAASYGWKMTVMSSNARRSHNDEPWHLRYLGNTINNPGGISPVAQQSSQPQRRDVFGSIGRFLGLRR